MPKMKTNKAAKKRYSLTATGKVKRTTATLTATGKVKRTTANRRHLLANKTKRQKLSARRPGAYADKSCENTIQKLLPYGN